MSENFEVDFDSLVRYARKKLDEHSRSGCQVCETAPEFMKETIGHLDAARDTCLEGGAFAAAGMLLMIRVAYCGTPEMEGVSDFFRVLHENEAVKAMILDWKKATDGVRNN